MIEGWQESTFHISKAARDFFSVGLLDKTSKAPEEMLRAGLSTIAGAGASAAVAAPATPLLLAAAPGLIIGALIYATKVVAGRRRRQTSSPFRYLSTIAKHSALLAVTAGER